MAREAGLQAFAVSKLRGLRSRLWRAARRIHHRPRHFLSAYAIMQNEGHSIREWIEIHLREGVEHFYLVDHGSTDDWRSRIEDHIRAGRVSVTVLPDAKGSSTELRKLFVEPALNQSEWVILQDMDEFMHARTARPIADFLRRLPGDVGQVAVPWVVFGTGGNIEQPRFVLPGCLRSEDMARRPSIPDKEQPWHAKGIIRSRAFLRMHIHIHDVEGRTVLPLDDLPEVKGNFYVENRFAARLGEFRILQNHYIHQSLEFYRRKMERKGYWLENNRATKSYTMERFEREEARLNAVENRFLLDRHRDYYAGLGFAPPEERASA